MEKQILIPIILVLGLLTCGIGIYLYIRCRNKPIEALKQIVVDEQINKPVETSVDNTTNVCDDIIIPVDDVEVVEENLDQMVRVGNLMMTERDRLRLKAAAEKRGVNIDNLQQAYNNMMNNQIAGLERLEQGCDRIIEAGNGFIQAGNGFIEAGNAFIAHCDNMIQSCNNSIVFGTLALGMSAVSIDDEEIQNNLNN